MKQTNNPNPFPTGKIWFGLYWFGAADRGRTGTVRNVIDFGAFIDIGVHQDGLVHISQITNRFIKHPSEVLKVGDIVKVWVLSVDVAKKRIGLTMKQPKNS